MKNTEFEEFLEKYRLTANTFSKLVHVTRTDVLKYIDPEYIRPNETGRPLIDNAIWKIETGRLIIEQYNMIYPAYDRKCACNIPQEEYIDICQQHYEDVETYKEKFAKKFKNHQTAHEISTAYYQKRIAANLKYLRAKHGYTLVGVEESTGISRGSVSHYEKYGVRDRMRLEQIAKFYGVTVEQLKLDPDVFKEAC